jgi:hypothetical protein
MPSEKPGPPSAFHRFVLFADGLTSHPFWHLFVGVYFLGSGIFSLASEIGTDIRELTLRTHHGLLALGILIVIRSVAEFLENMESSSEAFESVRPSLFRRAVHWVFRLMHRKALLLAMATLLFFAGFTDAAEFFVVQDQKGTSSALLLWMLGTAAMGHVVLGSTEALEHLSPGQLKKRLEGVLSPRIQLGGALVVLSMSIWEGALNAEEASSAGTHQAAFVWAVSEGFKNGIRSIRQIMRVGRSST